MTLLFVIAGIYLGAVLAGWTGAAFGLTLGYLLGSHLQLKKRTAALETELKSLKDAGPAAAPAAAAPEPAPEPKPPPSPQPEPGTPPPVRAQPEPAPAAPRTPTIADRAGEWVVRFFTTGNVVVKVGVIVLFFGVAFLIKYAVDRNALPVELRLTGIALGGIAMLVTGWRLRAKRRAYALVLQGGAVGILYLTVFAAFRMYHLVDAVSTLVLMVALVVFSTLLALLQNARSIATFAAAGGFLAPVLASTGGGSHVALFSYYALLNCGIAGVAWSKAWRSLNWVGFAFTFVIGLLWGYRYYEPHYFSTTEPFLVFFFLLYVAIAVLFSLRQPPNLRGLVDGTLVFGVPLAAFALQRALVADIEFGSAWSALGMATVYLLTAKALWARGGAGLRLITESFLALGVVFATLSIPLALDGRWTAAAWSLEGGALVWIGIRQGRRLPRYFGMALQVGAGLAFLAASRHPVGELAILNSAFIGSVLVSLGGFITALCLYRERETFGPAERDVHALFLVWALCWWLGAGGSEINRHVEGLFRARAMVLFVVASFLLLEQAARRLQWRPCILASATLLPLLGLLALHDFSVARDAEPYSHLGFLSWPLALAGQYILLRRAREDWPDGLQRGWHAGAFWLLIFVVAWAAARGVDAVVDGGLIWGGIAWGVVPALFVVALQRIQLPWPVGSHRETYFTTGLIPVLTFILLWFLVYLFRAGDPAPLSYVPVLNPLDMAQLFLLIVFVTWHVRAGRGVVPAPTWPGRDVIGMGIGALAFLWLNAGVARAVHFSSAVPYNAPWLFQSELFQSCISIVWTLVALSLTAVAARLGRRRLWFTGAFLIAAVVFKLFIIDLKDTGTMARIVSFLTVGGLLLVIGYLSPLPPRNRA